MRLRVTCQEGFEDCCAREAGFLGGRAVDKGSGHVIVDGPFRLTYTLNRYGRTVERVMMELASAPLAEHGVMDSLISTCDLELLGPASGVTLDCDEFVKRIRPRWMTQLSTLLTRAFRTTSDVKTTDKRPEASLFLGVHGETASLYADTTGEPLNYREYRRYNHPSSIRPTLAASLVIMSDAKEGTLYDPFCGGGTILIEAALMSALRPTHTRRTYLYRNFLDFDPSEEERAVPPPNTLPKFNSFVGTDINSVHIRGCAKNVSAAGLSKVELRLEDCTRAVIQPRADAIVTNPPYGVRGSKANRMEELYQRFLANLPNLLKGGGRAVVVTSEGGSLKAMLARRKIVPTATAKTRHSHLWVEAVSFRLPPT